MNFRYRDLEKISFPAFILPCSNWQNLDGLIYVDNRIVDDRNMPGATLGARRLQSPHKPYMIRLSRSVYSLSALIKMDSFTSYIDNNGVLFTYQKSAMSKLKYYKIKRVDLKDTASLLWLEGVKKPFKIPRPPSPEMSWAGILHLGGLPWILYEYSEDYKADTVRKV